MSKLLSALLGAGVIGAMAFAPAPASAMPTPGAHASVIAQTGGSLAEPMVMQVRDHRYRGGRHYGSRQWRDRHAYRHGHRGRVIYRHRGPDPGALVAAGIFGLATGALAAGALAPPPVYHHRVVPHRVAPHRVAPHYSAADIAYCARKYRSFDPVSFTFLGYDGRRHFCRIP